MSSCHNLAYALPICSTSLLFFWHFLALFHCSFVLKLINGRHIFKNARNLIIKHDSNKYREKNSHEKRCCRQYNLCAMHEHKACVIVAFVRLHSYQHECVHTANEHVNQEKNKVLLIIVAYTIIDPRAVMVHPSDASLTR